MMAMEQQEEEGSSSSSSPVLSDSEIQETIDAAETLVLLSSVILASNSSSAATTVPNSTPPIRSSERIRCNRNIEKGKNVVDNVNVTTKKVTFRFRPPSMNHHLDVPECSTRTRKSPAASDPTYHISDELDLFELRAKKVKHVIRRPPVDQGPIPPPDMPDNVKAIIDGMGGTGIVLITQKKLTATDVNGHNNRLQMPFSQIFNPTFLTDNEKHYLTGQDQNRHCNAIETPLLDPALSQRTILLRRWLMTKDNGARWSENYVLNKPWKDVVTSNDLREGEVVQLWGFRVSEKLNLALIKL